MIIIINFQHLSEFDKLTFGYMPKIKKVVNLGLSQFLTQLWAFLPHPLNNAGVSICDERLNDHLSAQQKFHGFLMTIKFHASTTSSLICL